MGLTSITEQVGAAVALQVHGHLSGAPITEPYRVLLGAALALHGNILSPAPDLRWTRPTIVSCVAAGGVYTQAVPVAAAVEVQMVALDLLDDVEDGESNPLLETCGLPATVNATTGLIYLAQQMLLRLEGGASLAAILTEAGLRATGGQHADLTLTADAHLALDTAMETTAGKSGSLMAAACHLGAAAAGADAARLRLFARFGFLGGVVAQLANDIRALAPDAVAKTDRALRRPTLPLVYAARNRTPTSESDQSLADREGGASYFAWGVADAYRRHALSLIPALTQDPASRADLAGLLRVL